MGGGSRTATTSTILVVDDEPDMLYMVRAVLKAAGYTVETANGGEEALESLRVSAAAGRPPDLIVTDLRMPTMTGEELIEAVESEPLPMRPKIVVVTAYAEGAQHLRAKGSVSILLPKPFRAEQLTQAVGAALAD